MNRVPEQKSETLRKVAASRNQNAQVWKPDLHRTVLFSMGLAAIISGCLMIGYFVRPLIRGHVMDDKGDGVVLVEVKAVQSSSAPFAAAKIFVKNQFVGLTDSYGEWRRYMKLSAGEQMTISIQRNHLGDPIELSKHVIVPLETKGSQERGHIRAVFDVDILRKRPLISIQSQRNQSGKSTVSQDKYEKLYQQVQQDDLLFSSVRTLVPRTQVSEKVSEVGRKLTGRLKTDGIKVVKRGASWWVKLEDVSFDQKTAKFNGLLSVESGWEKERQPRLKFLVNYQKSPERTARKIADILRVNVAKKYLIQWDRDLKGWKIQPALKPFWSLKKGQVLKGSQGTLMRVSQGYRPGRSQIGMSLSGVNSSFCSKGVTKCLLINDEMQDIAPVGGLSVVRMSLPVIKAFENGFAYIGGFPVTKESEDGVYRFWARPGYKTFLSILEGEKIVHRQSILATPVQRTQNISRR